MNLVIDAGNTLTKLAVFEGGHLINKEVTGKLTVEKLRSFIQGHDVNSAIFSSVSETDSGVQEYLSKELTTLLLDHTTLLPIKKRYHSPETLGTDRIACAVGAFGLFPHRPVLSIDAGTCIKYDFINFRREYMGGAISPGIRMRMMALHNFTARLPLLEVTKPVHFIGRNTEHSMISGVLNGAIEEVKGFINLYTDSYPNLKVVLTGGDMEYFEKPLKSRIFAAPDLLIQGLNLILEYNAQK